MLKSSIAIAALIMSAPVAFAQGAPNADRTPNAGGNGAGMSDGSSHQRSGASSGASEGASGSNESRGQESGAGPAGDHAPDRMKSEGSTRDNAKGHEKQKTENKQSHSRDGDAGTAERADGSERNSNSKATNEHGQQGHSKNAADDRNQSSTGARGENDRGASTGKSQGTEGRSERRGSVASVTSEQRTKARSAFGNHRVAPARDLNVTVNVGVRLPRTVHLYPVPRAVIEIVPAYREYDYIQIDDNRIAIIDPVTFEVVDIIVLA